MIPKQLQHNHFRFIKVKDNKAPVELEWTTKNNYLYYDSDLKRSISQSKRYGVVTGYGNLVVIDFDNEIVQNEVMPKLPKTFSIKTAGKGLIHLYYFTDKQESFKVLDLNKETLADVQGEGKQVIGPNSEMKGKKYRIVNDIDIASIKMAEIKSCFSKWLNIEETVKKEGKEKDNECKVIREKVKVHDLLQDMGVNTSKNPTECPLHTSKGGRCFSYNEEVWHCFHCEAKGNIFHLYMAKNSCEFLEAKKALAKKAGIKLKKKLAGGLDPIDYIKNVKNYREHQPFFYDKAGLFWFWNHDNHRYELWDDIDVMNSFDDLMSFNGITVNSKLKGHYLEAFKRVGRKNLPENAPKKWVQFKDKAYSLESGQIYDVTPEYFFTNPVPWEIGVSSETPIIDKLFEDWVGKKYLDTLYEIIAYCCYTDYPIQLLFCLYGSGRNGKSCFQRLLNRFLGHDNICSTELDTLLNSRFETFKLYRKLVCSLGETNFGVLAKTSLLKKLVGGDVIGFEKKNKDPFDSFNYAKIIIASNSLPSSDDTSEGFYRRWLIIDFPNEFPEGKDILETIPEHEYVSLAKKVTETLPKLLDKGFFNSQGNITQRQNKYLMSSNPLPIFIELCCIKDEDEFISYNELYVAYKKYLKSHKKRRVKMKEFKFALEEEGFWVEKTAKKMDDNFKNAYWVDGLLLKDDWKTHFFDNFDNLHLFSHLDSFKGEQVESSVKKVKKVEINQQVLEETIE